MPKTSKSCKIFLSEIISKNCFTPNELILSDDSSDAAEYYIWRDYIPDDLSSPLVSKITAPVNMCLQGFSFGTIYNLKAVAVDGSGELGKANISNLKGFQYINLTKGATIISAPNGASSTAVVYDDACNIKTGATEKNGLDITTHVPGTARIAYQPFGSATINATTDVPLTAYVDVTGSGNQEVEVTYNRAYAGKTVFIEFNNKLVSVPLPTSAQLDTIGVSAIDTTSTPVHTTVIDNTSNYTLDTTQTATTAQLGR